MFSPILMFYPNLAKQFLSYRTHNKEALAFNAKLLNASGWRIPWESAFTLTDVTPNKLKHYDTYGNHINGFVSFNARQYLSATRDLDWLMNESGNELINKLAEYWQSRMTFSEKKSQFEILNVVHEWIEVVNNSVTTNILASMSIFLAEYSNCLTNVSQHINKMMLNKARCIHVPFDKEQNVHLEFENYEEKERNEFVDIVLLGFPLMWPMDNEVRMNDIWLYEAFMNKVLSLNLA